MPETHDFPDMTTLARRIKAWGEELGFQQVGITDTDLAGDEVRYNRWLAEGRHGEMHYMERHGSKRTRPPELVADTRRIISARMDYLPPRAEAMEAILDDASAGYVSRYALGRDYHKILRKRLQRLADRIESEIGRFGYRAFVDSAPVLEKPLARKAGLGWQGKHTNLLNKDAGSWFFLGELYTDLPLPIDEPATDHCGSCRRCIDVCPTGAITAPYELDARKCISYLTIENPGSIPVDYRKAMGNRIYGCDDCQIFCPWNKFARTTGEEDFVPRNRLDGEALVRLFAWSREEFLERTRGSAIRRIGHEAWLRNIAVALGNAPTTNEVLDALAARRDHPSPMVREHVEWALEQHGQQGRTG